MGGLEIDAVAEFAGRRGAAVLFEAQFGDGLAQQLVCLVNDISLPFVRCDDGAMHEMVSHQGVGPERPCEVVSLEDLLMDAGGSLELEDTFDEG